MKNSHNGKKKIDSREEESGKQSHQTSSHITDSDQNRLEPHSKLYTGVRNEYKSVAQKEQKSQVVATLFSMCTLCIEVFVAYFVFRVAQLDVKLRLIIYMSSLFIILLLISFLSFYQLSVIKKWNQSVDAKKTKKNLTKSHLALMNRASEVKSAIFVVLLFCIIFGIVFWRTEKFIPRYPRLSRYRKAVLILRILRALTLFLTSSFFIYEVVQYRKWSVKIQNFSTVQQTLRKEIPNLEELEVLVAEKGNNVGERDNFDPET